MYELGFLGAGNMAEAIARSAITRKLLRPEQMIAADISEARRQVFGLMGVSVAYNNADVIRQARQVLVAVKPQTFPQVAKELAEHAGEGQVILTIMAGVSTQRLAEAVTAAQGKSLRIVRIMPNTPLQIGFGMAGICLGKGGKPGDASLAMQLFGSGNDKAIMVDESKMDAITAVSGSGPAYLFYLAEAMQRAAEDLGLGEHAETLVKQTLLGAAHLLSESGEPAVSLRRRVTSPGGTTEAAIQVLDRAGAQELVVQALAAAARRSVELGEPSRKPAKAQ